MSSPQIESTISKVICTQLSGAVVLKQGIGPLASARSAVNDDGDSVNGCGSETMHPLNGKCTPDMVMKFLLVQGYRDITKAVISPSPFEDLSGPGVKSPSAQAAEPQMFQQYSSRTSCQSILIPGTVYFPFYSLPRQCHENT